MNWYIFFSFAFAACSAAGVSCEYFQLHEGFEYVYKEEVECHLRSAGTIQVKAKVSFTPIRKTGRKLEISQAVYRVFLKDKASGQTSNADSLDFNKWFSFVISLDHGDIEKVYHPPEEDPMILSMKKSFAALVFGKLHSHDDPSLTDVSHDPISGKWNYTTHENGHEGLHSATYMAEPTDQGVRFTKTRNEHPHLKAAVNNYTKVLHYDSHLGLVSRVDVDEFIEIGNAPKGFDPFENDRPANPNDTYIRAEFPTMVASSTGQAALVSRNQLHDVLVVKPVVGLMDGMIHVDTGTKNMELPVKDPDYANHVSGNLTCLRKIGKYGSTEGINCFRKLARVLKTLPNENLIAITKHVFNASASISPNAATSEDILHIVDALVDVGTDLSIKLLVDFAFQSNPVVLKRMLAHMHDVNMPSFEPFDHTLERYCFFPETFPVKVQDEETHHSALLALGSLVNKHNIHGRSEHANRLVSKLENMLGIHDDYAYNKIRSSLSEDEVGSFDMKHAVLLESLGNAEMNRSYDHIISYVNSTRHSFLKRSALHALRSIQHDNAVASLFNAATKDDSMLIRHESALILQRHRRKSDFPLVSPPGSDEGSVKVTEGPKTLEDARRHRYRRNLQDILQQVKNLFKPIKFNLKSPSIDWRKVLGSMKLGASFGTTIRNELDLHIRPLEGNFNADAYNEAYTTIHLGIVGVNVDLVRAKICFYGSAKYNLNILQEFNFNDLLKQIKDFFKIVDDSVDLVNDGIEYMHELVNGEINIKDIIAKFADVLEEMPKKMIDIGRNALNAMAMVGSIDESEFPPFLRPTRNVIVRITNLYTDIKNDVMDFYNEVTNAVMTFKRAYKTIYESVESVVEAMSQFLESPKQAISAVFKGVMNIKTAITDLLKAKNATMEACFFLKDEKPYWWDLKTLYREIKKEVTAAINALVKGGKSWTKDIIKSDDPIAKLTKLTTKRVREKVLAELKSVIDILVSPLKSTLGNLVEPFLKVYNRLMDIVQRLKDSYVQLKTGYEKALKLITSLFGTRAHALFPRTQREASSGKCGISGFFPSNIGYKSGMGIDLLIHPGKNVVAPFAGSIMLTDNANEVKISTRGGLFSKTDIFLTNVEPDSSIRNPKDRAYSQLQVYAGQVIGVATSTPCRTDQNHIHFVVKKRNGKIIDPTRFIEPRKIHVPTWIHGCNDYKYVFMGKVQAIGWKVPKGGMGQKKDLMPPRPAKRKVTMKPKSTTKPVGKPSPILKKLKAGEENSTGNGKEKSTGRNILNRLGLGDIGQSMMDTLKKYDLMKLQLGKIITFLYSLGMKESIKQLAVVIKRIKDLIDSKPCLNPHQLTVDQLRTELTDRMLPTNGSREQMAKRLLSSEPKCPLIQLKMPKQIYCVFDENCLAVQCCMNLKITMFNKAVRAYARLDPCDFKFVIGVDSWSYEFQVKDIYLNIEKSFSTGIKFGLFDMKLEIIISYKLEKTENAALVSFSITACSQDDHTSCIVNLKLLDEAVLPIPVCNPDGTMTWPDVDWSEFFSVDAIKNRLKETGKRVLKDAVVSVAKDVLNDLGIPESLLTPNGPCTRPWTMKVSNIKKALHERGLAVNGSRADMNNRLNKDDLSCKVGTKTLSLPEITNSKLKKVLYYSISSTCTRIDACVDFTIKAMDFTKSFRAFVDLDFCKYKFSVGFEKFTQEVIVFVFPWGKPQTLKISDNIFIMYTIDKDDTKKAFIVDLGIKLCLAPDNCPIDFAVLEKQEIPQPLCNENFSLGAFNPGDVGKFLKGLGGEINKGAFNFILKMFKLDTVLSDDSCKLPSTSTPTCPWRLNLDWLPQKVKNKLTCKLSDNCFGVSCCLHLPFKLPLVTKTIDKYVEMGFEFDPCEFTIEAKFGSFVRKETLGHYNWGEVSTITIGEGDPAPVLIRFSIGKSGKNAILNMKVTVCLEIEGTAVCIPDANGIEIFKDKSVPLCDANAMAELVKNAKELSLKDYMKTKGLEIGKAVVGAGIDMFLEQTGIREYLKEPKCDSSSDFYSPSVDGWKNECNLRLFKLPKLPNFVKCHFDEGCTSIECCVDVNFYEMYTHSFHFFMTLDTCDLVFKIGFEKLDFNYTLLKYHWGKIEEFDILKLFNIKFSIGKDNDKKIFILNAELCVSFNKDANCDYNINFMEDTEIPQLQCDIVQGIASLPPDINSMKKYMGKLGSKATGMALNIPLRMLGLGSIIGVEGLCPDSTNPVKNPCPLAKDRNISLPMLPGGIVCAIQSDCHGIECCASIDLGFMQRSFRAFATIDPFSYKLTVGFENWNYTRYLFTYEWGKEESVALGSSINFIFSFGKTKTDFQINLRLEAKIAEYAPLSIQILQEYDFPIPTTGEPYRFPFPSWKEFKKNIGGQAGEYAWEATKRFLGLEDVIDGNLCSVGNTNPDINKERCPTLNMPKLPSGVQCTFDELCFGVTCCVELDFKVVKKTLKAWLIVDTLDMTLSAGFEKKRYDKTVDTTFFGERTTLKISQFFHLIFKVTKINETKMLSIYLDLQMKLHDEVVELRALEDFKIPQVIKNVDWRAPSASELKRFLGGSITSIVMKRLDLTLDFFDNKPCPLPSSPPSSNACNIPLPKSLSNNVRVIINPNCLGIQACIKFKILSLEYNFKAYAEVDPKTFEFRIGVEKLVMKKFIFENFGKENTFFVRNALGVTYKLETNDKGQLVTTVGIRICLDHHCSPQVQLLDKAPLPMPYVDDGGTLVWPSTDPAQMKNWLYNKALETSKDLLGVGKNFFRDKACTIPTGATCPYFSLPNLPSFARCKLSRYCTGIECCLDVQMRIAKWSFKSWALLDPCKFVFSFGFEKWMFNDTLFDYNWGQSEKKNIADTINMEYTISLVENRYFQLSVKFSIKLDKFSISIPPIVLFDKAKIPIPICSQTTGTSPRVTWQDPRQFFKQASAIVLSRIGVDTRLLEQSSCTPFAIDNNKLCPQFTLPKKLPSGLSLHVMDTCTGIEACLALDLKVVKRSFKAWIVIDPCKFTFSLGFEKWVMKKTLSLSLWGHEFLEKIGSAITLKYTVDKTVDNRDIIFTLKVVLCLDGKCLPDIVVIDKAMMPIPFCGKDGSFQWLSSDPIEINGILRKVASSLLLNRLGVEQHTLFGTEFNLPAISTVVCPYIRLPALPLNIKCQPSQQCTGIICSASLDLKAVKRNFKVWAILDPCEFSLSIGFERVHYNRSLTGYTFGTQQKMKIGHITIIYTIDVSNNKKEFIFDLDLQLCLDSACVTMGILKQNTMPIPFCEGLPGNFSISWPSAQNYGSLMYNILGVGLDFFKPKPCVVQRHSRSCASPYLYLPIFTQNHCELRPDCLGIQCCFELDLHISKLQITFFFYINQCKKELHFGLENKEYTVTLDEHIYAKSQVQAIGNMFTVKYTLRDTGYTFKANLELDWCWKDPFTNNKTCSKIEFLKEATFKQVDCPSRKRRSLENNIDRTKRGLLTKGGPRPGDDIWAITKALSNQGKSPKEIKAYFDNLKKQQKKVGLTRKEAKGNGQREQKAAMAGQGVGSFMSGNRGSGGDLKIEGAEDIKEMLGTVKDIAGHSKDLFTPGKGLNKAGVDLLGAQLAGMTIGEITAMIDSQNLDPMIVLQLLNDIKQLFVAVYDDLIDTFLSGNSKEMNLPDLTLKMAFSIPKKYHTFYKFSQSWIVGGIVPLTFSFKVDGFAGLDVEIGAKVLQMKVFASSTPYMGVEAFGEVAVGFLLYGKLRIEGTICELRFPCKAEIAFSKFPLDVRLKMDMVLVPLIIRMKALVTLEVNLLFVTIKTTLFQVTLFEYQAPSIKKTIFDIITAEEDDSPPKFDSYEEELWEARKRSTTRTTCSVHQVANRDYTSPAIEISVKATDDRSQVKLFLNAGLFPGTSEFYNGKELSGQTNMLTDVLPAASGQPLHFRMCGSNSGGKMSCVDCSIPTYDVTPPVLRVQTNFHITSNPNVIEGSYRGFDDSSVADIDGELVAIGIGRGIHGDQVARWTRFSSASQKNVGRSGDDPATLKATHRDGEDSFTAPMPGRLMTTVTKRLAPVSSPNDCAKHCLEYVPQRCMSFNYVHGSGGACELLEGIQSIDNRLTKSDKYYHFERLGIGSMMTFSRKNLKLKDNNLYYINVRITNRLGYQSMMGSKAILTDFTVPVPGPLGNYSSNDDVFEHLSCNKLILGHEVKWGLYCRGLQNGKKNRRRVLDGRKGAKTVFNGLEPMTDLICTQSNRYISSNWDGFYDPDSGIRGYTLAAGRKVCDESLRNHHDPHNHLFHESEWTHSELIDVDDMNLPKLDDGFYYLTLTAFNKVDYGGPLAVTVCHSTPYCIDNTEPLFKKKGIHNVRYDEDTYLLQANHSAYTCICVVPSAMDVMESDVSESSISSQLYRENEPTRDPESGLKKAFGGLSRTQIGGCDILEWSMLSSVHYLAFIHKLPNGVPVWVKVQVFNHVDLYETGVADYPITVDDTPPVPGEVNDGEVLKIDQNFTKYAHKICANWFDFSDPDSGIDMFELSVGTTKLGVDVVNRFRISSLEHKACIDLAPFNKTLIHGKKYCFTVTAWNGAVNKKYVNASSDCVLVDLTKPENGDIIDGNIKGFVDLKISSMPAMIGGQLRNFHDPESGLIDTAIQVKIASSSSPTKEYKVATSYVSIKGKSYSWATYHLNHKDWFKSTIRVTNGAYADNQKTTDGVLVDLTPPFLDYIFDGKVPKKDINFQTMDNEMTVNYEFHDDESGIAHYKVLVYETYENTESFIGESTYLPSTQTVYTKSGLNIKNGAVLYGVVESENTAVPGVSAVFRSSGVKVDKSPPVMQRVSIGVTSAGEHEERHNNTVIQSDRAGITASWIAVDSESGVEEYEVCVGTTSGGCDVLSWKSVRKAEDGYIGNLNLELTQTSGKYYYVSVRARNGADSMSSPMTGTRLAILEEDVTGHLIDGPDGTDADNQETIGADWDVTLDEHSVTMQFEDFRSQEYGIQHIEWAIGTTPNGEDVQPFMSEGVVLSDRSDSSVGQVGFGKASAPVDLERGIKYFSSVRATTYEGNVLQASSNGFTVDQTPPEITITNLGIEDKKKEHLTEGHTIYQQTDAILSASWHYTEDISGIAFAEMAASTIPGEWDIHPLTNVGKIRADNIGSIPNEKFNSTIKPRKGGVANILEIYVGNDVGLMTTVTSAVILIDDTPPTCGTVTCPLYSKTGATGVTCSWSGFMDDDSGISSFQFGIGTAPGKDDVYTFKSLTAFATSHMATNFKVPLKAKNKYYATLKAKNMLGLECEESSDAMSIDDTAPIAGVIVETTDLFLVDFKSNSFARNEQRNLQQCKSVEECQSIDATCRNSLHSIGVAWTPFTDPETGIASVHLAVGTSPGGAQIRPYTKVPKTDNSYLITGLNLQGKKKIYVSITAYNGAGISTSATSNGVYLSYVPQGAKPLRPLYVWDVNNPLEDKDFQTDLEMLSARWDFGGDPCPALDYEWRIERADGKVIQNFTSTNGQTYGSHYDLKLKDGEEYQIKVKSTNVLGLMNRRKSDGLTIRKDQLLPGRVNDGDLTGFDLNFLESLTKVDTNWHDFGRRKISTSAGVTVKEHQKVSYYEVALGTDRRFPHTRNNIHAYLNVGRNISTVLRHLNLNKHGFYYFTVRAHSVSTAMAEVTSNGFRAGYDGGVEGGEIDMPEYWGSLTHLLIKWKNFQSKVGMLFYHVGVANTVLPQNVTCKQLILSETTGGNLHEKYFPVVPLRQVGGETMIELKNTNLTHKGKYFIYVVGTDGAGLCMMVWHQFIVDATPPEGKGELKTGPYWNMGVTFTQWPDQIAAEWRGYSDPDSGIERFEISLWTASTCNSGETLRPEVDWLKLTPNYANYSLIDLTLIEGKPYFVKLRTYNKAELFVESVSKAILVDITAPGAGKVVHGRDFSKETIWQKDTTEVHGTFLHWPTKSGTPCPDRSVEFDSTWKWYDGVGLGVKKGVYWGIMYSKNANRYQGKNSYASTLTKVEAGYTYLQSGAIFRNADIDKGGDISVTIRAADGDGLATTSVLLWDGPDDELQEQNWHDEPDWTQSDGICECCYSTPLPDDCPCDCDAYKKMKAAKGPTSYKSKSVALKKAPTEFTRKRACGFQLIAGKSPLAVLWCSSFNETSNTLKEKRDLKFNPANESHTYLLKVFYRTDDPKQPQWCFKVYEASSSSLLGEICGIEEFSSNTKLVFNLWNRNNFIPKSRDWTATAWFSYARLPPSKNLLCRHGKVFRGGTSAIISYEAGIGTGPLKTDVASYKVISRPCVPCIHPCDIYSCDKSCLSNQGQNIKFSLTGLSLPITPIVTSSSDPAAIVYFLTVKAVLGSGASVVSSSKGFQIDNTPCVFDNDINVTYIDTHQGQNRPVSYQSSNDTLKAVWRAVDNDSMVVGYEWGIGRKPGDLDMLPMTSVGKYPGGIKTGLAGILRHNHTYYVTVICINAAGLQAKYVDEKGVTVLLEKPIVKDQKVSIPGKTVSDVPKNSKQSEDGTTVSLGWSKPRDKNIKRIHLGIGTSVCVDEKPWDDDVFPFTLVGIAEAGVIKIKDGAVYLNDKKLADLCKYLKPKKTTNYTQAITKTNCLFNMEIGRTIFMCMKLCNQADMCTMMECGSVTFVKDGKCTISSSKNGKAISVNIIKSSTKRAVDSVAEIQTPDGLQPGQTLIVGPLDGSQVNTTYGSDASVGFKKYIQDPSTTKTLTERVLKGRIVLMTENSFFVTSVGHVAMPGPIVVSVAYLEKQKTETTRPMLLHWDTGKLSWLRSSKTCTSYTGTQESFDTPKLILNTLVCQTHSVTAPSTTRRRRATSGGFFDKETQFVLAEVSNTLINNPPVATKEPVLTLAEDSSILSRTLTATDEDGDKFVFAIDGSKPKPTGTVTIARDGKLEYYPCMDCVGLDTVYYTVTEIDMGEITPLTATASLVIKVTDIPDGPELFLSKNGAVFFSMASTISNINMVNVSVEQFTGYNSAYRDLVFLAGAYDRDSDNVLTISSIYPLNGKITLGKSIRTKPTFPSTCSDLTDAALPCTGLNLPHKESRLSWVLVRITYKPNTGFYGKDSFVLKTLDSTGLESNKVMVNVYILQNPCKNSGTCQGLQDDLNCTDSRRAFVKFKDFYNCSCSVGWEGPTCAVDHDDCINVPCAFPFTCVDKLNGFECVCPADWPNCETDHLTLPIVFIFCMLAVFAACLGLAFWLYKKRKAHYDKYKRDGSLERPTRILPPFTKESHDEHNETKDADTGWFMNMPGVKKHISRMRNFWTKNKVSQSTKGNEVDLTRRHSSIVPPVGKPKGPTNRSEVDNAEIIILESETVAQESKQHSGLKRAWPRKNSQKKGLEVASGVAFQNPAFMPEDEAVQPMQSIDPKDPASVSACKPIADAKPESTPTSGSLKEKDGDLQGEEVDVTPGSRQTYGSSLQIKNDNAAFDPDDLPNTMPTGDAEC